MTGNIHGFAATKSFSQSSRLTARRPQPGEDGDCADDRHHDHMQIWVDCAAVRRSTSGVPRSLPEPVTELEGGGGIASGGVGRGVGHGSISIG